MKEVARDVKYINGEYSWSQYLALSSACLSISDLTPPPTNTTKMAFAGRWETETQEGYDAFCKVLGENAGSSASSASGLHCFLHIFGLFWPRILFPSHYRHSRWCHREGPWLQVDHRGHPGWQRFHLDPLISCQCQGHQQVHYRQGGRHGDHWRKEIQGWKEMIQSFIINFI